MAELRAVVKLSDKMREWADKAEALEASRDEALAAVYRHDPVTVARVCDEELDRSGGLLGRVRRIADQGGRG